MANLESPNQFGSNGNTGSKEAAGAGGKIVSPIQVGAKGGQGSAADQATGNILSPSGKTNSSEAKGHK